MTEVYVSPDLQEKKTCSQIVLQVGPCSQETKLPFLNDFYMIAYPPPPRLISVQNFEL